jgi:hypothetical protein
MATLTVFTCCLLLVGGTVAYRLAYPPLPLESEALLAIIDDQVAELRSLEFQTPVPITLITAAELRQNLEVDFAEEFSIEEARNAVITLAAFDLIEAELDLYQLYLDLFTEQIAGYYDPEEETLYVIANNDRLNVSQRITLAHELTHALQDQHFDLDKFIGQEDDEVDTEADFAFRALVEGEASLLEQQYLTRLAPHEFLLLIQELMEMDTEILDQTPHVIAESQIFPYREGLNFVTDLYDHGGWPTVNAAYDNPPVSTEQILHPDRYRAGDVPQVVTVPPLTDTLGSGWRRADEDSLGEFFLRLHLESHLSPTLVLEAAEGWGGDRYAVYHNDDDNTSTLLLDTVWDTTAEADEFLRAYTLYLDAVYMNSATTHAADLDTGNQRCWRRQGDHRCLWWQEDEVIIIRAPDEAIVTRVLLALGRE